MACKLRTKLVRNLTKCEFNACRELTLGHSSMRPCLEKLYGLRKQVRSGDLAPSHMEDYERARVILLEDGKKLLAWGLIHTFDNPQSPYLYIFVKEAARGQGLGQRLMKRALKDYPQVTVCPWSKDSRRFYRSYQEQGLINIGRGYGF